MLSGFPLRLKQLQTALNERCIGVAIIADANAICYLTGFPSKVERKFRALTLLVVPSHQQPVLFTSDQTLVGTNVTPIRDIRTLKDGRDQTRMRPLAAFVNQLNTEAVGIEIDKLPSLVWVDLKTVIAHRVVIDVGPIIEKLRMVKSDDEVVMINRAGEISGEMMSAACDAVAEGGREFEVALAAISAGTRAAASRSTAHDRFSCFNIMQSAPAFQCAKTFRKGMHCASERRFKHGEITYLCFCGASSFNGYTVGFDRGLVAGNPTGEQAAFHSVVQAAHETALEAIQPGVGWDAIDAASGATYRQRGYPKGRVKGWSVGMSLVELAEFQRGSTARLQVGMTLVVDTSITAPGGCGARLCDTVLVTETGFRKLTRYPTDLTICPRP